MGTFVVKFLPPQIQGLLFDRARLQLRSNVPMQSFMPPIVLGMSRTTPFQINPQSHPPDRQPAQSQQPSHMGKGAAVVTTDGSRQSMPFKQPLKTVPYRRGPRVGHPPQLQHVTAVFIPHRQRFATTPLHVIPPAFEIHRPHLIGRLRSLSAPQPPRLRRTHSAPTGLGQTRPLQNPLETALRCGRSMLAQIQLPNLARSPIPVRLLESHHLADHSFGQLIGMAPGPARLLRHPRQTIAQHPLTPFVTSFGADPIFLTQRAKVVRLQRLQAKLHSLFHRFTFFPGHP